MEAALDHALYTWSDAGREACRTFGTVNRQPPKLVEPKRETGIKTTLAVSMGGPKTWPQGGCRMTDILYASI